MIRIFSSTFATTFLALVLTLMTFASRASAAPHATTESALEGTKWTFSFLSDSFVLDIIQDFTTPGVLRTTATCNLSTPITVTIEAPVELRGFEVINRTEVLSPKKYLPNGSWCMAMIPRRVMDYTFIDATHIKMNNDPLHPAGMIWNLIP